MSLDTVHMANCQAGTSLKFDASLGTYGFMRLGQSTPTKKLKLSCRKLVINKMH